MDTSKPIPPIKLSSMFQDAGPTSEDLKHSSDLVLWLYGKARDNPVVFGWAQRRKILLVWIPKSNQQLCLTHVFNLRDNRAELQYVLFP